MNIQVVLTLKSNEMVEQSRPWINFNWSKFSDTQRGFIQEQLQCCGLETTSDRVSGKCKYENTCMEKFVQIGKNLRNITQKFILVLFFIETLGLLILALLKFGKK